MPCAGLRKHWRNSHVQQHSGFGAKCLALDSAIEEAGALETEACQSRDLRCRRGPKVDQGDSHLAQSAAAPRMSLQGPVCAWPRIGKVFGCGAKRTRAVAYGARAGTTVFRQASPTTS